MKFEVKDAINELKVLGETLNTHIRRIKWQLMRCSLNISRWRLSNEHNYLIVDAVEVRGLHGRRR